MKLIIALVLNVLAQAYAHDHPSVHGMLVVGKSKIYLSHLPMFHSPHDYQVILEAEINQEGKETYLKSLETSTEKIYTLVPEVFVLPEMLKNPKPFKAQIYKGHFERGGAVIAEQVIVKIKKIIFQKKFNPNDARPEFGHYILFGNEKEKFLAHAISIKPDFDQIVKVESSAVLKDGNLPVVIKSIKNTEPLAMTSALDTDFPIVLKSIIYTEKGDLGF